MVVTRLEAEPWCWEGGPWVADIFVVPSHRGRGLGLALLLRAIPWSHAAGEAQIGLTVTDGNPAEQLYVSAGFPAPPDPVRPGDRLSAYRARSSGLHEHHWRSAESPLRVTAAGGSGREASPCIQGMTRTRVCRGTLRATGEVPP